MSRQVLTSGGAAVAAALSLLAAATAAAAPAGRGITSTSIDPVARVLAGGHSVEVSGLVTCPNCRRLVIGFTATQSGTGAVAVAASRCRCTPKTRWRIRGRLLSGSPFVTGRIVVCGWVVAYSTGPPATQQRCRQARATVARSP